LNASTSSAQDRIWPIQPAELVDRPQQLVRNASDNLNVLAMHVGVRAAEVGSTGSDSAEPCARRVRHPSHRQTGWPTGEDDDVVFTQNRRRAL
jgi:hypothetical protein